LIRRKDKRIRCSGAKILGLDNKGHLGVGADGDVAVYDCDPKNLPKDKASLIKIFENTHLTIKGGVVVCKDGEFGSVPPMGRVFWGNYWADMAEDIKKDLMAEIELVWPMYYSVSHENYMVTDYFIKDGVAIKA